MTQNLLGYAGQSPEIAISQAASICSIPLSAPF
jgi:hypothetical protein